MWFVQGHAATLPGIAGDSCHCGGSTPMWKQNANHFRSLGTHGAELLYNTHISSALWCKGRFATFESHTWGLPKHPSTGAWKNLEDTQETLTENPCDLSSAHELLYYIPNTELLLKCSTPQLLMASRTGFDFPRLPGSIIRFRQLLRESFWSYKYIWNSLIYDWRFTFASPNSTAGFIKTFHHYSYRHNSV